MKGAAETIASKRVKIREDRHGKRRYWVMVDGTGLFQRGRLRVRTFTTVDAALGSAREEISNTKSKG